VLSTKKTGSTTELHGRAQFDPYGKRIKQVGWEANGLGTVYGCAGSRWDEMARMNLMGHRWYDPEMGRFIEQDPIGESGGYNLYAYVNASPVMWVDPKGLRPEGSFGPENPASRRSGNRNNQTKVTIGGVNQSDPVTGGSGGWLDWGSRHQSELSNAGLATLDGAKKNYHGAQAKLSDAIKTRDPVKIGKALGALMTAMSDVADATRGLLGTAQAANESAQGETGAADQPPGERASPADAEATFAANKKGKRLEGLPDGVGFQQGQKVWVVSGGELATDNIRHVALNAARLVVEVRKIVGTKNVKQVPLQEGFESVWNAQPELSLSHVIVIGHNLYDGIKGVDGSMLTRDDVESMQPGVLTVGGTWTWLTCSAGTPGRTNSLLEVSHMTDPSHVFGSTSRIRLNHLELLDGTVVGTGWTNANWVSGVDMP
jgi:RHS repeat-associated protein